MNTSRIKCVGEGTLLDIMPDGILVFKILGKDIKPCYLNSSSQNILACTDEQFFATKASDYADRVFPGDMEKFNRLKDALFEMRATEPVRLAFRISESEYVTLEVGMTYFSMSEDDTYVMFTIKDVTEEEKTRQRLGDNLIYDNLTGLFTESMFGSEVRRMLDQDSSRNYYIISGDIDRFSAVVELYGYEAGDRLLRCIGSKLSGYMSDECKISRISSDNFAACLSGDHLLLGKIANLVTEGINEAGFRGKITWHAGIFPISDRSMHIGIMCDRAHSAAKRIKNDGNTHFAFYDKKYSSNVMREHLIIQNMNGALTNGEFEVHYQPIFDAVTKKPACAEALVRWRKSDGAMVPPGEFINVFEKCGFIRQLDYYLWEQVCRDMRMQLDEGNTVLPVSVNMSRYYAFEPGILDDILQLTSRYGIDHSLLRFEVTESIYGASPQNLLRLMKNMQDNGFVILLDDYGSGYSTPSSLIDIPFDIIKIDREFVQRALESERCRYIISAVLQMADKMHVPVVAEGVETEEQFDVMKKMSCDFIQGYYFSRPLQPENYQELLRRYVNRCGASA
ncbi:MAG: putative bifunctional diguanylate cyclase/phosphodiesterase [Anaerovoracaceae bacterium]|jgi:EAL domain-containing protein (putative c-di-GMP-specific phosphodiesterase class I)/GGDEF domain-containing protein